MKSLNTLCFRHYRFPLIFSNTSIYSSKKYSYSQSREKSKFKFSPITAPELQLCLPGIAASFAQVEPLITLKIQHHQVLDFLKVIFPVCLKRGISNIVRDEQTGTILGCTIMFDTFDQKQIKEQKIDQKVWGPIFKLLHDVSFEYLQKNNAYTTEGLYAHSFMTAIFPEHKNCGVGRELFQYQLKSCKAKGYKYVMRETTNHIARHILLNKLKNFKELKYIKYSDLVYNGVHVMKDTPHGASLVLSDLSSLQI